MKFKKTVFFIFVLSFLFSCLKSKNKIDETNHKIHKLHKKIKQTSRDSMLLYFNETKKLFNNKINYPDSLKAENYFLKGLYFDKFENLDSTIFYYEKALSFDYENVITNRQIHYYFALIKKYYYSNNYTNSLNNTNLLIKKLNINDYKNLGLVHHLTAMTYIKSEEYKKALVHNFKSIFYHKKIKNKSRLYSSINLKSKIYYELNKKDSAKIILKNLLKNDKLLSANNKYQFYTRLGIYNFYDNEFNHAKKNYLKALVNVRKINNINKLANCYNNLAEVYLELKKYNLAETYLDSTFLLGIDDLQTIRIGNALRYKLQLLYVTKKEIKPVLNFLDTVLHVNNQHYKKKMDNESFALIKAHEKEKIILKQNQESELKNTKLKRNQLFLFLIIMIFLLTSIIGVLQYRKKKIKFHRDELMLQQRLFRAQMNPHFTSNILYNIQNLFKTNVDVANEYLIKFSRLLRLNLENSIQNYVSIDKEIEAVEKYLELQKLRFPNTFNYKILGDCIDNDLLLIPPMLIQPFVENAIEHGFKNINYLGNITIQLNLKENFIFCEIVDNGIGISKNTIKSTAKKSSSTKLIKQIIKKMTTKDVLVSGNNTILDKKGTKVQFFIPYKEK